MTDIAERLRAQARRETDLPDPPVMLEAADEIVRLRALPTRGQMIQAMLRARDSMGNCTALQAAEACADAALELLARAALNIHERDT